jgi:hypothetical protein
MWTFFLLCTRFTIPPPSLFPVSVFLVCIVYLSPFNHFACNWENALQVRTENSYFPHSILSLSLFFLHWFDIGHRYTERARISGSQKVHRTKSDFLSLSCGWHTKWVSRILRFRFFMRFKQSSSLYAHSINTKVCHTQRIAHTIVVSIRLASSYESLIVVSPV